MTRSTFRSKPLLAFGLLFALAAPAGADVFSSQSFSGETATLNHLPGVSFDGTPGMSGTGSNCVESEVSSFGRSGTARDKATTCQFGRFSITTSGSGGGAARNDLIYGGNPPPWQQGWRP